MKQLAYWLEYIGLRFLIYLVGILPNWVRLKISTFSSFLLQNILRYRAQVIEKNLRNSFPNESKQVLQHITNNYYQHLSNVIFETLHAFDLPKKELLARFQYENVAELIQFLKKEQSVFLVGSHYGNWEMGCLSFPLQLPYPIYTVYKPLKNPFINQYLQRIRSRWGMQMVPMRQLGRILIANKNKPSVYIFLMDQSPASTKHAIWKPFLNQETPFIHGVEKIVQKMLTPVFYFAIQKKDNDQHAVNFQELYNGQSPIEYGTLTHLFIEQLTQQIGQCPSQWLWSHNRWKRAKVL